MKFAHSARPMSFGDVSNRTTAAGDDAVDRSEIAVHDRRIGQIIGDDKQLTRTQIDQVLAYQRERGVRFGQAVVALHMATDDDVLWALSQQFNYPYAGRAQDGKLHELVVAANPFSAQAEAFRELRAQLMSGVLAMEGQKRALAVVSPDVGDGKTFIAANLAVAFSQLGALTLLIDVDMRTPRQHRVFGMSNTSGLSGILSGRAEANVIQPVPELPHLFVMPVGNLPPNPLELVQRPAFGMLIHELLTKFDYVIVDTPATVHGADSRVVAGKCGAALAVGREGTSRLRSMQKLLASLERGPKLAGVVINER